MCSRQMAITTFPQKRLRFSTKRHAAMGSQRPDVEAFPAIGLPRAGRRQFRWTFSALLLVVPALISPSGGGDQCPRLRR
jgi:hypothetical protein